MLEDFEASNQGEVPKKWYSRKGKPQEVYHVEKEKSGNQFLRAVDHGKSIQLFRKKIKWDTLKMPHILWKWRIQKFPAGANELDKTANDSAAGIYVIFRKSLWSYQSIKYVWSQNVPVGTVIRHKKKYPIIVVRSQQDCSLKSKCLGQWVEERRNVVKDYQNLFGQNPPSKPYAIGLLTDANSGPKNSTSNYSAQADYDDIRIAK